MKIKKIYNNNIVLVEDEKQLEMILLGAGIAFKRKAGEDLDPTLAEKRFVIDSPSRTNQFIELMNEIPPNHLELSHRIIEDAQKRLGVKFSDMIYIGLTDHINYALHRYKQNLPLKNQLLWEIKRFYPKEFEAAKAALKIIGYYENIYLPEDEAGYIALHFVNASQDGEEMETTILVTETVQDILELIQNYFSIALNEKSLDYERLVTHIRYFTHRLLAEEILDGNGDILYDQVKEAYPQTVGCVAEIKVYFKEYFRTEITKEEQTYFMLHIGRVIARGIRKE